MNEFVLIGFDKGTDKLRVFSSGNLDDLIKEKQVLTSFYLNYQFKEVEMPNDLNLEELLLDEGLVLKHFAYVKDLVFDFNENIKKEESVDYSQLTLDETELF